MERKPEQYEAMLTLGEVLLLPPFDGCRVLAGEAQLGRSVLGLNQLDAPDIANWAHKNELLITTGFVLKDDPDQLAAMVTAASTLDLAGICIKPKRFIDRIPDSALCVARKLDFPLIELPETSHFNDMLTAYYKAALQRQNARLERSTQLNALLMKMMLEGVTLERITLQVAQLISNTVVITDTLNSRTATSQLRGNSGSWEQLGPHWLEKYGAGIYAKPLVVGKRSFGEVRIVPTDHAIHPDEYAVVDELVLPLALEISREYSLREIENSHFNDYLIHLFHDKILDWEREEERALSCGLPPDSEYLVCCLKIAEQDSKPGYSSVMQNASVFSSLSYLLLQHGYHSRVAKETAQFSIIITPADGREDMGLAEAGERFGSAVERLLKGHPQLTINAGCGRPYMGLAGMIRSQREALVALKMCRAAPAGGGVLHYKSMGLLRFIYSQKPMEEVGQLVSETLGSLLDYNPSKRDELLLTLRTYFACFGNLKKVSEVLYTHYNTIIYRVKRIEELTGLELDNEDDRLLLEVALRLHDFINTPSQGSAFPEVK